MPTSILCMLLFSGIAIIYFIADHYSKENRISRLVNKTNKVKINKCKQNEYVQIIGKTITGNKTLKAPFSQRPCIGYYACAELYRDSAWIVIGSEIRFTNFFLEDTEGNRAMIRPGSLYYDFKQIFIETDYKESLKSDKNTKPRLEKFLEKHDVYNTNILSYNDNIRFREGIIDLNENISIIGIAKWKIVKDDTKNYNNTKVLLLTGTKSKPLTITNLKN